MITMDLYIVTFKTINRKDSWYSWYLDQISANSDWWSLFICNNENNIYYWLSSYHAPGSALAVLGELSQLSLQANLRCDYDFPKDDRTAQGVVPVQRDGLRYWARQAPQEKLHPEGFGQIHDTRARCFLLITIKTNKVQGHHFLGRWFRTWLPSLLSLCSSAFQSAAQWVLCGPRDK